MGRARACMVGWWCDRGTGPSVFQKRIVPTKTGFPLSIVIFVHLHDSSSYSAEVHGQIRSGKRGRDILSEPPAPVSFQVVRAE